MTRFTIAPMPKRRPDTVRQLLAVGAHSSRAVGNLMNREGRWLAYRTRLAANGRTMGEDEAGQPFPRIDVTDFFEDGAAVATAIGAQA